MEEEDVFLWGWGAGTEGQIGIGVPEDQLFPQPLLLHLTTITANNNISMHDDDDHNDDTSINNIPPSPSANRSSSVVVSSIACGGAHTLALTDSGKVLTWGRSTHGQLGHGNTTNYWTPKFLWILESCIITSVSAGWNHSGFVTDSGRLLTCGDGSYGQLGHGDHQSQYSPIEVSFFVAKHVKQIACGTRHSIVLVNNPSENSVYSFGSGRHGQLGIPSNGNNGMSNLPKIIVALENEIIKNIFANGDHSAALSFYGQLYFWGRAFSGRLNDDQPYKLPSYLQFCQVALGWNHALLLTDDRELYMLGGNHHGKLSSLKEVKRIQKESVLSNKLGLSLRGKVISPRTTQNNADDFEFSEKTSISFSLERVPTTLVGEKVMHIGAGSEHSGLVTENGTIMTWGWGEHGQLGLGNTLDHTVPQVVILGSGESSVPNKCSKVYCGSGFTFALKAQH